ncbi:MAG: lytic transglycosylase domain-containing protein [Endomicrobium sp.]|jgi:soluble lytic murein transglycosylase|nr:lytic transglycosylase domain-containing protein [Endomicrobium sp.]
MKKKTTILLCSALFFILCLILLDVKTGVFSKNIYDSLIAKYSSQYGIDPLLIKALMKKESNANPDAISFKGAVGLMQIMPKTAGEIANRLQTPLNENSLKDPEISVMFGAYYLKQLLAYYNGNLILALAAYNAGIGNVDGWTAQNTAVSKNISKIPFKETRRYIRGILFTYNVYKIREKIKI